MTFGQKVTKLNSRPVYCSQLYGIFHSVSIGNGNANEPPNTVVEEVVVERKNKDDEESSKMFSCLKERPLWFLFLVMTINGLFSLACSALIIKIEKPAQDKR